MKERTLRRTLRSVSTALFAAIICIGTFVSIPMPGGVPITVQNMFAVMAGTILGGIHGAGSVGIFIILGGVGLRVFSGMNGGMGVLVGTTGGYIWGYFLAALLAGLILGTPHTFEKKFNWKMWLKIALTSLLAYTVIYVPGVLWFRHLVLSDPENKFYGVLSELSVVEQYSKVLAWTVTPYIPGDLLKWILTIPLTAVLRPVAARYLWGNDQQEEAELIAEIRAKKARMDNLTESVKKSSKK